MKSFLEEPLNHDRSRIELIKRSLPRVSSHNKKFAVELNDAIAKTVKSLLCLFQSAPVTSHLCDSSSSSVSTLPEQVARHRNAFLTVGVVAMNIEHLRTFKPVIASVQASCIQAANALLETQSTACASTTALSSDDVFVLLHSVLTCSQQLLQSFPEQSAESIPSIISVVLRLLSLYAVEKTLSELPLVDRCVEYSRIVLASHPGLIQEHAQTIGQLCVFGLNKCLSSPSISMLASQHLEIEFLQLLGHLIRLFANLPKQFASRVLLLPSAPTADEDESGSEDELEHEVSALPAGGLLNLDSADLEMCIRMLATPVAAITDDSASSSVQASNAANIQAVLSSGIESSSLSSSLSALELVRWQLIPYLVALRSRNPASSVSSSSSSSSNDPHKSSECDQKKSKDDNEDELDDEPCVEWLQPVMNPLIKRISTSELTNKSSVKAQARDLETLAKILRGCPACVLGDVPNEVFSLVAQKLSDAKQTSLKNGFATIRPACVSCFASLMYALDNGEFDDFAEDFVFHLAPLVKDSLVLSDCVYVCRSNSQLLNDVLLPKVCGDLIKGLNTSSYQSEILVSIIESLSRIFSFLTPTIFLQTSSSSSSISNGFKKTRALLSSYARQVIEKLVSLVPQNANEIGMASMVCLTRLLYCNAALSSASQSAESAAASSSSSSLSSLSSEFSRSDFILLTRTDVDSILRLYLTTLSEPLMAQTAFAAIKRPHVTEGGDEDNKDQEMPEDLLSQLQLCTLEMLKFLFIHPSTSIFMRSINLVPASASSAEIPFHLSLKVQLLSNQQKEPVFEDEVMLHESSDELISLLPQK